MKGRPGLAAVLVLGVSLAGCTDGKLSHVPPVAAPSQSAGPARLAVAPANGARDVRLDQPVTVSVRGGRIESVRLTGKPDTTPVSGKVDAAGTWHSASALSPATSYALTARAVNGAGRVTMVHSRFATLKPARTLHAAISPLRGETVGVGMPIALYLSQSVTDRAAVERAFTVRTTPAVQGAWHWYGEREVHWRPRHYWRPGTDVVLNASLRGVNGAAGTWGDEDYTVRFRIGAAHVSTADLRRHVITVRSNGAVVRRLPTSGGQPRYPTKSGVHVVLWKEAEHVMDSTTAGITGKDAYLTKVKWATRISLSGEFVHAAPWSVWAQGHTNVSHGCLNVSMDNAAWFYGFSQRGDVVDVTGTPVTIQQGNGYADWNLSWAQWLAGSALRPA